jgi:hypothetical protein
VSSGDYFIDTWAIGKEVTFQIGGEQHQGVFRGLHRGVRTMMLGEEATFEVDAEDAYGSEGFTRKSYRAFRKLCTSKWNKTPFGVANVDIPPGEDVILDVALLQIFRDGKWYESSQDSKKKVPWKRNVQKKAKQFFKSRHNKKECGEQQTSDTTKSAPPSLCH